MMGYCRESKDNIKSPIVETTIDILCAYFVPYDAVIGIIFSAIKSKYASQNIRLEKLPINNIPEEIRNVDPNLKNRPTHQIICEEGAILLGANVFSITIFPPYISWEKTKMFIGEILSLIKDSHIIERVLRFSIKYLNFFESNIFENINLNINFNSQNIAYPSTIFRTEIPSNGFICVLQITNGVHIKNTTLRLDADGSLIDINIVSDNVSLESLNRIIEDAHSEARKLFFDLLKEEFKKSIFS